MPGAHKKGTEMDHVQPYQEPALVPLGEKPKVWWINACEGIRQISPVSLVGGVPAFVYLVRERRVQLLGRSDCLTKT